MRIIPRALSTTLDATLLPEGAVAASVNATFEHGLAGEARAGMAEVYKRGSHSSSDVFLGAGFGRYDGTEIVVYVVQEGGSGNGKIRGYNLGTGAAISFADAHWTGLSATPWRFHQFGAYLYAINATDDNTGRFWRFKITGTTSAAWERVPIIWSDYDPSDATVTLERPAPAYSANIAWNTGVLAGSISTPVADGTFYPTAASVSGTRLKVENTGNTSTSETFVSWFMFNLTSPLDLRKNRYWYFEAQIESPGPDGWSDTRLHEEPYFDIISRQLYYCWVTDNAAASTTAIPASGVWKEARVRVVELENVHPLGYGPTKIGIYVDFDGLQFGDATISPSAPNWISGIDKIAIGLPMRSGNDYEVYLTSPLQGGAFMSKPEYWAFMDGYSNDFTTNPIQYYGPKLKPLEYATVSYKTGPDSESSATFARISGVDCVGLPQWNALLPMGAGVNISVPGPASGFTGVRVFRRRWGFAERWECIYEGAGTTTITDYRVEAPYDIMPWHDTGLWSGMPSSPILRDATYVWGSQTSVFTGQCLTSWKGHMVIGNGEEVYFSFQGDPTKYLRPERDRVTYEDDIDDPTLGRTLYMSNTISDTVLGLVAQDALYGVGYEGVYALVGNSALDSTEFRKLPNAYGAMGKDALCPFQDGVIVANATGLYYVRVTRLGTALEETSAQVIELTKDIRPTWAMMIAKGAPNELVVRVLDDQIYAFRGRFCCKRNKSGEWEYHEYSSDALQTGATTTSTYGTPVSLPSLPPTRPTSVPRRTGKSVYSGFSWASPVPGTTLLPGISWLAYDSSAGSFGMSRSGILFRMDKALNGVSYTTDANYAIPYMVAFSEIMGRTPRSRIHNVEIVPEFASGASTGPIHVLVEEYDGSQGSKVYGFAQAEDDIAFNSANFSTLGGQYMQFIIVSGSAGNKIIHFGFNWVDVGAGKAN